jgi:FtsH-binding integral membrane protein
MKKLGFILMVTVLILYLCFLAFRIHILKYEIGVIMLVVVVGFIGAILSITGEE